MVPNKMMLYVNRSERRHAWGGGAHAVNALFDNAVANGAMLNERRSTVPDAIVVMGIGAEDGHLSLEDAVRFRASTGGRTKVILRINECDLGKGTSDLDVRFLEASRHVDGSVFVSQWMRDYYVSKGWACQKNVVIINGCEAHRSAAFEPRINGQISIVSHHWSDNARKSGHVTEWLDDFVGRWNGQHPSFSFTFIGRTRLNLRNSTRIQPLWGQDLWNELGQHDVYVSESRWEAGPNHVLEALALNIPTYVHKDGGGCVEFAGSDHTYGSVDELETIIRGLAYEPNTKGVSVRDWKSFAGDMFGFIREICKE